jgi:dipeptidyl aminopeptidase/acylaminoacyl peptidase
MTCWQITQSDRFAAAAAVAPLTDMRSFFFTAHHPEFLSDYSGANPYEIGGYFDQRSPLRHADKAATPTLLIAGALDRTAPASQAVQFHRALVLRGVPSECAIYPEEGHAALRYEAMIDQAARILGWFRQWDKGATAA